MAKKKKYDYKKTLKKMGTIAIQVGVLGAIGYATKHPELVWLTIATEGLRNYLKHKKGWEWL